MDLDGRFCKIDDLPNELLEYILGLIPPYKDLQECMLVSKRWYRATKNVIEHNEAHFQKSVAHGSLYWNPWPCSARRRPTIGKRHSHSACTYENSMYVFGGCTATCTTFNDLWRLDLNTRRWTRPITMGSYPSPKACATMLRYKRSFVLFGGWSHPSPYPLHQQWKLFNELHVYSIELNRWNAINTLDSPPPTSAHSASIHGSLMVVFGGICDNYSSNDVWCLNLDTYTWHKQATSSVKPQPRYGQSQIELGEKHLLILGGCTGPNVAMNDAWLLTMEGPTWTWKKVNMSHTEFAPTRIWCHQACRVGDHVIVLSKNKRQSQSNMSISLTKVACQPPASTPPLDPSVSNERRTFPRPDRDENVNGRHGFLRRSQQAPAASSDPIRVTPPQVVIKEKNFSMAAFRDEPLRSNQSINRQKQLESLRRMEERLQNRKMPPKAAKKSENTLSIFVLDISNVLRDECAATWSRSSREKRNDQNGPDNRILYSLVLGRGELIVFGGIRKEQATVQGQPDVDDSEVFNDLHFINPPKYVI